MGPHDAPPEDDEVTTPEREPHQHWFLLAHARAERFAPLLLAAGLVLLLPFAVRTARLVVLELQSRRAGAESCAQLCPEGTVVISVDAAGADGRKQRLQEALAAHGCSCKLELIGRGGLQ